MSAEQLIGSVPMKKTVEPNKEHKTNRCQPGVRVSGRDIFYTNY